MRILILHDLYQHLGGEDTVVQQEANALSQRGHKVKILTDQNKKGRKGIIQYLFYPFNILATSYLIKEIVLFKPDIVHIHNLHYAIGPLIVRKIKNHGIPTVMTLHNFRLICPSATLFHKGSLFTKSIHEDFPLTAVKEKVLDHSFLKTFITAFTYWIHKKVNTWNTIDRFFTFSNFSKDIFQSSTLGIAKDKFVIKTNFVTPEVSPPKIFNDFFVYIGRLSEEKGIVPLLEALSKTSHRIKIFGTGPQEEIVKDYTNRFSNIQYYGFQPKEKLLEEISQANALIVPSLCYEGMPMTIIEAFSTGTPVLCSNIGILEQMVVPLHTGLHFNPYAAASIESCVLQWSAMTIQEKEIISKNCINEFHSKYTKDKNLDLLEEVYQQTIKENEYNNYRSS